MIETIGNHRVFLNKTRALFDLGNADREVAFALERLEAGTQELPQSELGQKIRHHQERGVPVHLFVRRQAKLGGTTQPFLYAGTLEFQRWEGEKPFTVWWRMVEPVPEGLRGELRVGG